MQSSPAILVAIVVAARRSGDQLLEQVARQELEATHGVRLDFADQAPARLRAFPQSAPEVAHP